MEQKSILLLITGFILLGPFKTTGAIISTIIYPTFIDLTSNINNYFNISINNMFFICIIIGILSGITTGLVYKVGFSNGGFSIVSELLSKYTKISLPISSFIVNIFIVLLGGFSIGFKMIFYSSIILLIHSILMKIILNPKLTIKNQHK